LRPLAIGIQSPQVSLSVGLQADLLLGAGTDSLDPDYAKICPVLAILDDDQAPHFELAANRTQSNPSFADVESVNQVGVGIAGNVAAQNSYRQHSFGPV
jgi:hypothetical protein